MSQNHYKYIGKPHRLIEGREKVTGRARYVANLSVPGMLHARPILSPYAHARIVSVERSAAEAMPGVHAVLLAEDLITRNKTISSRNSAILAKGKVVWCGQPVAVVVAESEAAAQDAADLVQIEYEPLPAVADVEQAVLPDAPIVWPDGLPKEEVDLTEVHGGGSGDKVVEQRRDLPNVHSRRTYQRGDVQAGFAEADLVIENSFRFETLHQAYMEPHASLAEPDAGGRGVTVYTSTQGQFIVRDEVARILDLPKSRVRIVPMAFGGGFGAKYGILEPLAAALAVTLDRPVKVILTRSEDFLATTPAPAIVVELKTGVKADGTLTALQGRVLLDNGVFSFTMGSIAAQILGGYYRWPNLQVECLEVSTNKPQAGSYRAPTAPHMTFAIESHMDEMARRLGLDPIEFRLQSAVEGGDLGGTNKKWPALGLKRCLETMRDHPAWQERTTGPNEGIGLAVGGWPSFQSPTTSICRVDSDGTVNLHLGTVDISGINSSFVLVAAEILGVTPEEVIIVPGDTSNSPFAPGSGGSQVTYSVAGAVRAAAESARDQLLALAANEFEAAPEDIELVDSHAQVKGVPDKRISVARLAEIAQDKRGGPGPVVGTGSAAVEKNAPGFGVHLVKVRVEPETGWVTVLDYLAVQDVGFALNPMMVEGQMHGGIVQGIGLALNEALIYDENGQLLSGSFQDYYMPRAEDAPHLETVLVENPSPLGPFGVRGVGEPPIIAGPAAIGNAIRDAAGVRVTQLPMKPEVVWRAIQDSSPIPT